MRSFLELTPYTLPPRMRSQLSAIRLRFAMLKGQWLPLLWPAMGVLALTILWHCDKARQASEHDTMQLDALHNADMLSRF